ncbi:MAG: hypothetical protein ACLR7Z_03960 [Bilophila wadsworthia]
MLNELKDKPGVSVDERMADLAVAGGGRCILKARRCSLSPVRGSAARLPRSSGRRWRRADACGPCPHLGPCPLLETRERRWATRRLLWPRHGWRIWPVTPSCPRIR